MRHSYAALWALALCAIIPAAMAKPKGPSVSELTRNVQVRLPDSQNTFPPGAGAELANAQCMICHSVGMVTRQPPLSFEEWKGEVNKMRSVYGAPLPADQVDQLAKYLTTINGKP